MTDNGWTRLKFLKRSAGATAAAGGVMAAGSFSSAQAANRFGSREHAHAPAVGKILSVPSRSSVKVAVGDDVLEVRLVEGAVITRGKEGSVANLSTFRRGELVAFVGPRDGATVIATNFDLVEAASSIRRARST